MKDAMLELFRKERYGVVAVEMPDGSPHAATVHFTGLPDSLQLIIQTSPDSRKYEPIKSGEEVRATFVIGFDETNTQAIQFDGIITEVSEEKYATEYLKKFPEKSEKFGHDVFLLFTPTWWRFTDWTRPEGKTVLLSDGTETVLSK